MGEAFHARLAHSGPLPWGWALVTPPPRSVRLGRAVVHAGTLKDARVLPGPDERDRLGTDGPEARTAIVEPLSLWFQGRVEGHNNKGASRQRT
jgi:hypothetical protein